MHRILLSRDDLHNLRNLLDNEATVLRKHIAGYVPVIKKKLKSAEVLDAGDIKLIDIVTMNSSVKFKNLVTGEAGEYLIVQPKLECMALGRISIFSDLGVALFGRKKGEIVTVGDWGGTKYKIQILKVQPTSAQWIKWLESQC